MDEVQAPIIMSTVPRRQAGSVCQPSCAMSIETLPAESPGLLVEWFDFGDRSRGMIAPAAVAEVEPFDEDAG